MRSKFDVGEVFESMIEPGKVISDQYGSSMVTTNDGKTHVGLVVERGDQADVYSSDPKGEPVKLSHSDIAKIEAVPVSRMPPGLINLLNGEEIRDLVAYLLSAGDPKDKVYGT